MKSITLDAMASPIGQQNWHVCTRMLVHDLIDLSASNKDVKELLRYYRITFHPSGGFTMALPRKMLPQIKNEAKEIKLTKKQLKKLYPKYKKSWGMPTRGDN